MDVGNIEIMDEETIKNVPEISNDIWNKTETYVSLWAFGTGLFINLVALYYVGKKIRLETTNYYLINLITANIVHLILNLIHKFGIDPHHMTQTQCNVFPYLLEVILSGIVLNLLLLTLYWFNRTIRQNQSKNCLGRKRLIFIFIWVFCFIIASPFSFFNYLKSTRLPGFSETIQYYQCTESLTKNFKGAWTLCVHVIPMIVTLFLYMRIMKNIRESINAAGYSTNRDTIYVYLKQIEWRKKAVTFILLAVVTLFVCKFPENLYQTLMSWKLIETSDSRWNSFYAASFYVYNIVSAILFMMTSMKANMLARLEFNEKIETRPPNENLSLTDENSRL